MTNKNEGLTKVSILIGGKMFDMQSQPFSYTPDAQKMVIYDFH